MSGSKPESLGGYQPFPFLSSLSTGSLSKAFEKSKYTTSARRTLPTAAVQPFSEVYDCSVEASALRHANKCVYQHSASSDRAGLGENIYKTTRLNYDKVKAATQSSQLWWNELKEYGVGPSNNLTTALWNRADMQIGHYTQMAWKTSYRLGCAIAHCPSFTFGVCQYGPPGNYLNRLIYTTGDLCTSDSGCPGSYTCNAAEGLCNVV